MDDRALWSRIEGIFHAALERKGAERAGYIRTACEGDEGLRLRVESLLAHDDSGCSLGALTGHHLGPYEILAPLGAGGMGEVYRARDTRLDRIVAVKILRRHLSSNPQFLGRFEREAHVIASLSHPHICTLHDVGHQDGIDYLVMEYLDGQTLADRLRKEPLSLDQVLQIAIQITDALDTAHRHGVIHRDLKPGNIMLTKTGAKLLDFGLAKGRATEVAAGKTALPTETALTGEGTILGTLQYMSPEQLEGKEADARTDIFALGAVIYEMATGRKAFAGKSQASLIAAIMSAEPPPISTVQNMTPPALDHVARTCFAKDPNARWQTVHDVLLQLKWIADADWQAGITRPVGGRRRNREILAWGLVAAASLFAVSLFLIYFRQRPGEAHAVRFQIPLPERMSFEWHDFPVISPNGQRLVLPGVASDGVRHLWIRSLDSLTDHLLPGTEESYHPFWSPDSLSVAFFAKDELKRIDLAGGPPQTLCDAAYPALGGAWNQDDVILLSIKGGILRVSATGGQPKPVLQLDKSRQESLQLWPHFLPDGRHFLYLSQSARWGKGGIYVGSLDSKEPGTRLATESNASYSQPGFLVYGRQETVLAQPFDSNKLRVTGEAVPIAEHVGRMMSVPASLFSVSENGVLVYGSPRSHRVQLAWHNRDGTRQASIGEPGIYTDLTLSPDEKRLAVGRTDPGTGKSDLWILDLVTGIMSQLTSDASIEGGAWWSPDGRELVYHSDRKGKFDLYRKAVGGSDEELVFQSGEDKWPSQWLKDGSVLFGNWGTKIFYRLPLSGERQPLTLFQTEFNKLSPRVSPDGRWVAYSSVESGRFEVYVAAFPSFREKRQASNGGGCQPLWRKDGKELFYLSLSLDRMMSVDVKRTSSIETGVPRALFQIPFRADQNRIQFDVTGNGRRFIFGEPVGEGNKPITVVLNWTAGLTR
jgi:serine/threonine protein kinase/Tol biopolymer transport system component